jgi:trans-aconitate methyltransferase
MNNAAVCVTSPPQAPDAQFDHHARTYDDDLQRGLRLSGESADYFARRRAEAVAGHVSAVGVHAATVIEFGCGTGNNVFFLRTALGCTRFVGLEVAPAALEVARGRYSDDGISFALVDNFAERQCADLVFLNGVMHHVPVDRRVQELRRIHSLLRPGGLLALFENNPFNPGTHLVMRRIPFDRDVAMINPYRMKSMLRNAGFTHTQLRFHFVFPRVLRSLRWCETYLECMPLGAQYCVFATGA